MILNLIEVFLVSILPISLIKFKVIPIKFHVPSLFIIGFIFIPGLIYLDHISLHQIGLRTDNLYFGILIYLIGAVVSIFSLVILSKVMNTKHAENLFSNPHFRFMFIPISFAQQFLFQGFILFKLQLVFNFLIAIIITALIFGYMHTIFPKPWLSMILSTLGGLMFATLYTIYPNIIISSITHSVLNFIAVYLGFFTFAQLETKNI